MKQLFTNDFIVEKGFLSPEVFSKLIRVSHEIFHHSFKPMG